MPPAHAILVLIVPLLALMQTVFALAAGALFPREPLTATLVAGVVVCIVSVGVSQTRLTGRGHLPMARSIPVEPISGGCP